MLRDILLIAAVACIAVPVWAADDVDTQNSGVGGTIPKTCQMAMTGGGTAALMTLTQDGTGETAYDSGYVESDPDATILTLDANWKWKLHCHYSDDWSCPAGYNKKERHLQIRITYYDTGEIDHGYDVYKKLKNRKEGMLKHDYGVSDNVVHIQTRVLLDWTKDIPGTYS